MTRAQEIIGGLLLLLALASGVGVFLATRGAEIPDGFRLADLEGRERTLAEFRGRPLIVNFWATWCPPCRREIPLLKALQEEYEATGLTVVGVAVEESAPVVRLAEEIGFNYPILTGEQEAIDLAEALGIEFIGLPYTVFVNRQGRVKGIHTGELHRKDAEQALSGLLD